MDYPKLVEMIPAEKWVPLSDKLIGVILNSKNDAMPVTLANSMLLKMKEGQAGTRDGVSCYPSGSCDFRCRKNCHRIRRHAALEGR